MMWQGVSLAQSQSFQCEVGGRTLTIETGTLAWQANGAVTVRYGETVVLVTVCTSKEAREGTDFLPLTVDYEERLYAAGKIPGGFIRREGRPSEQATLASRLTDRPLRPLLPKTWRNEIQIVITVLSADQENDPDMLAVIGGSAALTISDVPFDGPVSAVHVGYVDGQLILNPTLVQVEAGQLDLVVASTRQAVVMVEAGAREASEEIVTQAIKMGHEANQVIIQLQEQLRQACGKPKLAAPVTEPAPELVASVSSFLADKLAPALHQKQKSQREQALDSLREALVKSLSASGGYPEADIVAVFDSKVKSELRASILERKLRVDGRNLTEIRAISSQVGLLPRTHGSALFSRGHTQVLTITTLGSTREEQRIDGLGIEETKRFMHHYNFPGFSSGEVKRTGSPGRREIGHGALAERALSPVLPGELDFPYTIRLVSEVLTSSGSTSMASVCASSLSLMDAGIPIKGAVAGIAMGLVTGEPGNYAILSDIEGLEDAYGDMDFKVAGTAQGITALQLDIKLKGIQWEILEKALSQAKDARLFVLGKMQETISANRAELSPYAPRMYKITINPDKIGAVIGSGGKTIRSIIEETKTTIDIDDDGTVLIGSSSAEGADRAIEIIESLTKDVEVGAVYTGKVTRIMNFGAMVEILPGKEGLVHVSELADYRVARVEDVVKVGDEVTVKVIEIDHMGRVNLSRRAVLAPSAKTLGGSQHPPESSESADYPFKKSDPRPPRPERKRF
jgi:polyribonucleotide nucleotidyltransferase